MALICILTAHVDKGLLAASGHTGMGLPAHRECWLSAPQVLCEVPPWRMWELLSFLYGLGMPGRGNAVY